MALTEKLGAIADAIRAKTGKEEGLTLDAMPLEIEGIKDDLAKQIIERTVTEIEDDTVENVGQYAFYYYTELLNVKLPNAQIIGKSAFDGCTKLANLELPNATTISEAAFRNCKALKNLDLPKVTTITGGFVPRDSGIIKLVFHSYVTITGTYCFQSCKICDFMKGFKSSIANIFGGGITIVIRNTDSMSILGSYESYINGKILVPSVLLEDYKSATNWSAHADKMFPLEDYTLDGTITGELDLVKLGVA